MQSISIQIQPEFFSEFDRAAFLARVRSAGRSPEIDEFTKKGKTYLTFNFFTEFPKKLWRDLQQALYQNAEYSKIISPISIAFCEDESHAEGFILLHHFDVNEKVSHL